MPFHIGPQIQKYRALLESKDGNEILKLKKKKPESNFRDILSWNNCASSK